MSSQIRAKFVSVSGTNSAATHLTFRDFFLFQEEGQEGIVVSSSVTINDGPMGDHTGHRTHAIRVQKDQVDRAISVLIAGHSHGVANEFWGRLEAALTNWDSQPSEDVSEEDANGRHYHRIAAGRGNWWQDPEVAIQAAPEKIEAWWTTPAQKDSWLGDQPQLVIPNLVGSDQVTGVDARHHVASISYRVEVPSAWCFGRPDDGQVHREGGFVAVTSDTTLPVVETAVLVKRIVRDGPLAHVRYELEGGIPPAVIEATLVRCRQRYDRHPVAS